MKSLSVKDKLLGALIAGTIILGSFLLGQQTANATAIPNAITSVSLESSSTIGQWDTSTFHCTWAVPDNSPAGSTFTLQLPSQLAWFGQSDFNLTDAAGDVVATAVADDSGLVTFTLTNFVTTHPNDVSGDCTFTTIFTQTQTQAGPTTLTFDVGATVLNIPIVETGPCVGDCGTPAPTGAYKNMYWGDNAQSVLHSYIDAPPTTEATNTVEITDTPSAGSAINCASVAASIGDWDTATGAIAQPDMSATYPATITCTAQTVTVTWSNVPAGIYTRLDLDSAVTDSSLAEYQNSGTVTLDGIPAPVQATTERTFASGSGTGSSASPTPSPSSSQSSTPTATNSTTTDTTTSPAATTPASASSPIESASTSQSAAVSASTVASRPGGLAQTGVNARILVLLGVVLIALGGGLTITARLGMCPKRRH